MGQRHVYERSLKLTIQEIIKCTDNLNKFFTSGDMKNFCTEVHGIKGSLLNIGAMVLASKAYELEIASDKEDLTFCKNHLPSFLDYICKLKDDLTEAFSLIKENNESVIITPELASVFKVLLNSFKNFDLMMIDRQIDKLDSFNFSGALKNEIEQIKETIMMMNYDKATGLISKLLN